MLSKSHFAYQLGASILKTIQNIFMKTFMRPSSQKAKNMNHTVNLFKNIRTVMKNNNGDFQTKCYENAYFSHPLGT